MNFRDLMNTLDNIDKPMLSEALTLSAVIALTSGYEQDDKVRIPKLADLAKQNGLEGLVDPVTGHYVSVDGEEEDEVPFEIGQKLAQVGLLPKNARLEQAGWFDNQDVWNKANAGLVDQSSGVATQHDLIAEKMHQVRELAKQLIALRDKHATSAMGSAIGGKPVLPSNAPSQAAANITPTFPSQTAAGLKESAGLADALMESFGYADESHPLSSASAFYAQNMGLYEKAEWTPKTASWSQPATTQGIQDTSWLGKSSSSPTWTAPSNSSTSTLKASAMDMSKLSPAKTSAMDTAKLAKSADAGLGVGEKLSAKQVGKSLAAKYAAPAAAAIDAYDAYSRYKEGDYTGAAISGLAGAAAFVPVVGAPVSLGLDALNLYRTYTGKDQQHPAATEPTTATKPEATPAATEPTTATKPEATHAATEPTTATKPEATPAAPTTTEKPSKGTAAKPSKGASVTAKHAPRPQHSAAPFDIKSFQTHLNSLGAGIAVDGKPGPATDAAVRTYLLHQR